MLSNSLRRPAEALSRLLFVNPYTPARLEEERNALGKRFVDDGTVWHRPAGPTPKVERPNVVNLRESAEAILTTARQAMRGGATISDVDAGLYRDVALYALFYRYHKQIDALCPHGGGAALFERFQRDWRDLLHVGGRDFSAGLTPQHVLAIFFQFCRFWQSTFHRLVGGSAAAGELRASVWQSVFTHDLRRYVEGLYQRSTDWTTLVLGPTGSGKELVARAIAVSRYVAFDPRNGFPSCAEVFYPLNLSALSPTLIESELFGHKRGAFTGATADRAGWLETAGPLGTIFLDEVGDLAAAVQVKLLRVLQERQFQRIGETRNRRFDGKLVLATHIDLAAETRAGRFRSDLYYRICGDVVRTPSLKKQLDTGDANELRLLVRHVADRVAPEHAQELTDEAVDFIQKHIGREYPWPGNFRELEQCVRNVMIHQRYDPPALTANADEADDLAARIREVSLTADELLTEYCRIAVTRTGGFQPASRKLRIDRRTIAARCHNTRLV